MLHCKQQASLAWASLLKGWRPYQWTFWKRELFFLFAQVYSYGREMISVCEEMMYRCHQNYFLLSLENTKLLTMPTFFFFPQSSLEHYESGKKESNFSSSYRRNSLAGPSPGSVCITMASVFLSFDCTLYLSWKLDSKRFQLHAHHSYVLNPGRKNSSLSFGVSLHQRLVT